MAAQSWSPRPEMLMTMILSFPMAGASFMAWATAWADSMAGMIPSRRLRYSKASTASLSVTGDVYKRQEFRRADAFRECLRRNYQGE